VTTAEQGFQARIDADGRIEPRDEMPDSYRRKIGSVV